MNIEWNESFDTNAFLALVSGEFKVNGYSFHSNGTARILDEQLDHNTSFTAMLLQEIHSGRAYAQNGLEIIIKSHLLKIHRMIYKVLLNMKYTLYLRK